jgi:hypothetical protein
VATLALLTTSCNVFSPLDHPTSDAQKLSKARACLDQGDFDCAKQYYEAVEADTSDATSANTAAAEEAFAIIDSQGVTMASFTTLLGDISDKGTGKAVTNLAETMALDGQSGEARRLAIYGAFALKDKITGNDNLKNLVEFIGGISLAGEILSETAVNGKVLQTGLVADPTNCAKTTSQTCLIDSSCNAPSGSVLAATASPDLATNAPSGTPTLDQLYWSIQYAYSGLSHLSVGGKFSGSTTLSTLFVKDQSGNVVVPSTTETVSGQTVALAGCFRQNFLTYGIGE